MPAFGGTNLPQLGVGVERDNDVNNHGAYSTLFGAYVEKSKSNGQRSKSTSQRSRSTHGQPQPKPNICACDPSKLWAKSISTKE